VRHFAGLSVVAAPALKCQKASRARARIEPAVDVLGTGAGPSHE
jgi:hypothetical protein